MQFTKLVGVATLALAACATWATPITPVYQQFGTLPGATFGGSGIPNNAVAITTIGKNLTEVTLGLTATPRFDNPPVTNDGKGTFYALPGVDQHFPSPLDAYGLWNLDYYIGGGILGLLSHSFDLLYDFTPTIGSTAKAFSGSLNLNLFPKQDSRNLGDFFLAIFTPALFNFDPTATGEYSFALVASTLGRNSQEVARSAIRVLVNDVPEPASLALVGIALLGLAGVRCRKA